MHFSECSRDGRSFYVGSEGRQKRRSAGPFTLRERLEGACAYARDEKHSLPIRQTPKFVSLLGWSDLANIICIYQRQHDTDRLPKNDERLANSN